MGDYPNPPLLNAAPSVGQVPVFDAEGNMTPTALGSLPAAVIPQAHPTEPTETATDVSITTSDLATTAATQTTPWGFASEAQAEAIATKFNLAVTDLTNLHTAVNALVTDIATLITWADALQAKLTTAGILD